MAVDRRTHSLDLLKASRHVGGRHERRGYRIAEIFRSPPVRFIVARTALIIMVDREALDKRRPNAGERRTDAGRSTGHNAAAVRR
jgi:predicted transcriptional regulator